MKPVRFIFFSWSVWLKAPSMHPAKGSDEDGHIPSCSDPRDDLGSQAKRHPAQAKQHHLGPGLEPRPSRWAGVQPLSCRCPGRPAIPSHSLRKDPFSSLLEF